MLFLHKHKLYSKACGGNADKMKSLLFDFRNKMMAKTIDERDSYFMEKVSILKKYI